MSAPSLRRMLVTSGVKLWTSEREKIHFVGMLQCSKVAEQKLRYCSENGKFQYASVPQLNRCIRPRLSWSLNENTEGYAASLPATESWWASDIIWDLDASLIRRTKIDGERNEACVN